MHHNYSELKLKTMKKVTTTAKTNKFESKSDRFMHFHGHVMHFSKRYHMCMHTIKNMMNMTCCFMSMPVPCKSPSAI